MKQKKPKGPENQDLVQRMVSYRLLPSKAQKKVLSAALDYCQCFWNVLLGDHVAIACESRDQCHCGCN